MALALGSQRERVRITSGLDMLAGIWLFLSAFLFRHTELMQVDLAVIGVLVTLLAGIRTFSGYRPSWPSWMNAIFGLWVLVWPWTLNRSVDQAALWNSVITGVVIIVLSTWSALATETDIDPGD